MGVQQEISRTTERLHETRLAVLCSIWAVIAIFSFLFASKTDKIDDDPYWAADGNSKDIRALKH